MVFQETDCELERLDLIKNENGYTFYKLKVNGKWQVDEFEKDISKNKDLINELTAIYALMDFYTDSPKPPQTKFRQFKINKRTDIYEFKSKSIRVYVIKKDKAFYVIRAGLKKNQEKDKEYMKDRFRNVYLQD